MTAVPVVHNEAMSRFEVQLDGRLAELVYEMDGDRMILIHTEVPQQFRRQGTGSRLVSAAIDYAAQRRLEVVPQCWFVRGWLERHPGGLDRYE